MTKYHITKKGEPAPCTAQINCRLGGENEHYSTREEAQKAFEESQGSSFTTKAIPVPEVHHELGFAELRYIDFAAQQSKIMRTGYEIDGPFDPKARSIYDGLLKNQRIERERLLSIFSQESSEKTSEDFLTSGQVTVDSPVPDAVRSSNYAALAENVVAADALTKERFYKLPTSFHKALMSNRPYSGIASVAFKELIKLATDLHENDTTWKPEARAVVPRSDYGRSRPGRKSRVGEAKDMQFVNPYTYSLLEDGVKLRLGTANADRFWDELKSDTVNKPKLTDYFKAIKKFK